MELGPLEVPLGEDDLALIGRATVYETQAKIMLSLALKRLKAASHDEWLEIEKGQFKNIVKAITGELHQYPELASHFDTIVQCHEEWREGRNLVVHTIWVNGDEGQAAAYCYRRRKLADKDDIVRAVNDCFRLAEEARRFAYRVAIAASEGLLPSYETENGFVRIMTPNGSVTF
jgi:hypothetical protein